MEGDAMDVDARGIIPRAVAAVFEGIAGADAALEFTLKVSYVEICEYVPACPAYRPIHPSIRPSVRPSTHASD